MPKKKTAKKPAKKKAKKKAKKAVKTFKKKKVSKLATKPKKRRYKKRYPIAAIAGILGTAYGAYNEYINFSPGGPKGGDNYNPGEIAFHLLTGARKDPMGEWIFNHSLVVSDLVAVYGPAVAGIAVSKAASHFHINQMVPLPMGVRI